MDAAENPDLAICRAVHARIEAGDPLRVVVGEKLYAASEIWLSPERAAALRMEIAADLARRIALLEPPDPDPFAPDVGARQPVAGAA